jgi:hypothetical protein
VIHGDIREPHGTFASPQLEQFIDFDQPLGLLLAAVLDFIPPEDDPEIAVRAFVKYLVPGSCLAVSHVTSDGTQPSVAAAIEDTYKTASAPVVFRTADQIRGFSAPEPGLPRAGRHDVLAGQDGGPGRSPLRCGTWPESPVATATPPARERVDVRYPPKHRATSSDVRHLLVSRGDRRHRWGSPG